MAYVQLPVRTSADLNSFTDINQLMENIEYVKALEENDISNIKNLNDVAQATYSPYYVQSSAPSSPAHGYLWYDTDDNKLYKYNAKTESWVEIDWRTAVQATPEWQYGKLRIGSDGILEIADGQATPAWHDCYPLIGAQVYYITDYTKMYYLSCGQTACINSNIIPIVYCQVLLNHFRIHKPASSLTNTLSVSGMAGTGNYYCHYNMSEPYGHGSSSTNVTYMVIANNTSSYSVADICLYEGGAQGTHIERHTAASYGVLHGATILTISSTAYYLGTLNTTGKLIVHRGASI